MMREPSDPGVLARYETSFAKRGAALALFSGVAWALACLLIDRAFHEEPFRNPELRLLAPLAAVGIHDFFSLLCCSLLTAARGKGAELCRTAFSRSGARCGLGTLLGATLGMGGYLTALSLVGPAYTLPITSMFPAFAAVMAVLFLKERLGLRGWSGLLMCVAGVCVVVYTPPEDASEFFAAGLCLAFLAAFGWAAEGVCVASSTDFADASLVLNIYYLISVPLYWIVVIPAAASLTMTSAGLSELAAGFLSSPGFPWLAAAGMVACTAYLSLYRAIGSIGVSRSNALNITYSLWGVILGAVFGDVSVTPFLIAGIVIILAGVVLIIGNPGDLVGIRGPSREEK